MNRIGVGIKAWAETRCASKRANYLPRKRFRTATHFCCRWNWGGEQTDRGAQQFFQKLEGGEGPTKKPWLPPAVLPVLGGAATSVFALARPEIAYQGRAGSQRTRISQRLGLRTARMPSAQ